MFSVTKHIFDLNYFFLITQKCCYYCGLHTKQPKSSLGNVRFKLLKNFWVTFDISKKNENLTIKDLLQLQVINKFYHFS